MSEPRPEPSAATEIARELAHNLFLDEEEQDTAVPQIQAAIDAATAALREQLATTQRKHDAEITGPLVKALEEIRANHQCFRKLPCAHCTAATALRAHAQKVTKSNGNLAQTEAKTTSV